MQRGIFLKLCHMVPLLQFLHLCTCGTQGTGDGLRSNLLERSFQVKYAEGALNSAPCCQPISRSDFGIDRDSRSNNDRLLPSKILIEVEVPPNLHLYRVPRHSKEQRVRHLAKVVKPPGDVLHQHEMLLE